MTDADRKILKLIHCLLAKIAYRARNGEEKRHWKRRKLDRDRRRLEQLLAAGFKKTEIARRLGVHRNTINSYLKRMN